MENQFTVRWDDPKLNIFWPIKQPMISVRDLTAPLL
jgi:dTDP-4-dehydrorhamnose 3,5-epimerase-like enzyme